MAWPTSLGSCKSPLPGRALNLSRWNWSCVSTAVWNTIMANVGVCRTSGPIDSLNWVMVHFACLQWKSAWLQSSCSWAACIRLQGPCDLLLYEKHKKRKRSVKFSLSELLYEFLSCNQGAVIKRLCIMHSSGCCSSMKMDAAASFTKDLASP